MRVDTQQRITPKPHPNTLNQAIRAECELIEELNFRFKSKQREDQYTEQLAVNLSRYPREEVLCGAGGGREEALCKQ